jgi:predicted enzyme related to lactoylglutathione lyase
MMGRPIHFEIQATDPARAIDGGLLPRPDQVRPALGAPVSSFVVTAQVEDLDATLKEAIDAGGDVRVPRMPVPGVGWLAYIGDTEGNILGLMEPDDNAPVPTM